MSIENNLSVCDDACSNVIGHEKQKSEKDNSWVAFLENTMSSDTTKALSDVLNQSGLETKNDDGALGFDHQLDTSDDNFGLSLIQTNPAAFDLSKFMAENDDQDKSFSSPHPFVKAHQGMDSISSTSSMTSVGSWDHIPSSFGPLSSSNNFYMPNASKASPGTANMTSSAMPAMPSLTTAFQRDSSLTWEYPFEPQHESPIVQFESPQTQEQGRQESPLTSYSRKVGLQTSPHDQNVTNNTFLQMTQDTQAECKDKYRKQGQNQKCEKDTMFPYLPMIGNHQRELSGSLVNDRNMDNWTQGHSLPITSNAENACTGADSLLYLENTTTAPLSSLSSQLSSGSGLSRPLHQPQHSTSSDLATSAFILGNHYMDMPSRVNTTSTKPMPDYMMSTHTSMMQPQPSAFSSPTAANMYNMSNTGVPMSLGLSWEQIFPRTAAASSTTLMRSRDDPSFKGSRQTLDPTMNTNAEVYLWRHATDQLIPVAAADIPKLEKAMVHSSTTAAGGPPLIQLGSAGLCEIVAFPPGTYKQVKLNDVEIIPSDCHTRRGNDWVRGQECLKDCRFKTINKRPSTIRTHFISCRTRNRLHIDPIKHLCQLQIDALRRQRARASAHKRQKSDASQAVIVSDSITNEDDL